MEIQDYYAKPNQTIGEHADQLLCVLQQLKKYGYIEDEKLYHLIKKACQHHDDGKVNPEFQLRVKSVKKKKFNRDKEIPHNVLSGFLLDCKEFEEDQDFYRVLFAIMYHHDYGDPYEMIIKEKKLIKELLKEFELFPIKRKSANIIQRMAFDNQAIKIKGFLHKCDYSASGNYIAEYPNDFLENSLENIKIKWKQQNPDSDWNELQKFCMSKKNENIIVVAQTGMGKTEAGLQWIGNHKGYFVLPLRTAINAIYDRVKEDILLCEEIDTRLSVLHSESLEYYSKSFDDWEMDLLEYENRGKRFSMPLNISTMDQLFDFVFKYQGYELKLTTLSYSKIVIDEIQMYDPEMLAYLIYGLKKITQFGGKIAVMTATLSPFIKELLIREIPFQMDNICTFTNDMVRHHVKTRHDKINVEDIVELYWKNQEKNKSNKILVVCNTIKKAQNLYEELQKQIDNLKELHILHSRFTREEREKKEKEIISFGKTYNEIGEIDEQSGIWISTSLVEASLDIDFDYLFTELQDLNSLLQRFGRCNRKGKKDISEPNCFVYLDIDKKLLTGNGRFIDETIFNVSRRAMQTVNGLLSEKQKIRLLNNYLTMDNLKESEYYRGERGYKKTLEWIEGITPYEYTKDDNHLRNILSKDIIPSPVFEEKKDEIQYYLNFFKSENASSIDKIKAKEEIMKYSVNIPYWQWIEYMATVKNGTGEVYPAIQFNRYNVLPVMECIYDELGYRNMDYKNIVREPNFI
ncbi:MAG: CRISPR-associated helicase Cas3' [Lachnospiraceae bacterium]|nr:CRISPR-associated helicase Cas3' [Lachnospiraceae bacterium]